MKVVVCGTGTEVGKTHVGTAVAAALRARGVRCAALKPIESGGSADARALEAASAFHVKLPPPYQFGEPLSPHLAARREGRAIRLDAVIAWIEASSRGAETIWIETAGGLFSPVSDQATNADLVKAIAPNQIVLVAMDRLGVLHDLRAVLLAARPLGLPAIRTVLSTPSVPDGSTGTNAGELSRLGICQVEAVFPPAPHDAPESAEAATKLLRALGVA